MLFRLPPHLLPAPFAMPLFLLATFLASPPTMAEDGFVSLPCPIEGQENAVVLGTGGSFHAACLALSTPHDAGPWPAEDRTRIDGSSRFCPRGVLTVLDQSGAITVRFLPAPEGSFLADPAACCRAAAIAADPADGRVRIATAAQFDSAPAQTCFGTPAAGGHEDLYRWDGMELTFIESRSNEAAPAE